jgi:hypothetical protein
VAAAAAVIARWHGGRDTPGGMSGWIGFLLLGPGALLGGAVVALRGDGRAAAAALAACGLLALLMAPLAWGTSICALMLGAAAGCWHQRAPSPRAALLRGAGLGGALAVLLGLVVYALGPLPPPSSLTGPGAEAYLLLGASLSGLGLAGALGSEPASPLLPLLLLGAGALIALTAQGLVLGAVGIAALLLAAAWGGGVG